MPTPKPVNRRPWDAVRAEFEKARTGAMLHNIPPAVGLHIANRTRWSRLYKALQAIGITYWEDLQFVYPEEIAQHDGLGPGAVTSLKLAMPQAFSIGKHLLRASTTAHTPTPAPPPVNGPFEVYKVLAHFNIMHAFIARAITCLACAHSIVGFSVAEAALCVEYTLETGAGLQDPVFPRATAMMSESVISIAREHWGVSNEIAEVIELLTNPWIEYDNTKEPVLLAVYVSDLFMAYRRLLVIGASK